MAPLLSANENAHWGFKLFLAAAMIGSIFAFHSKGWAEDAKPRIPALDQYIAQALEGNNDLKAAEDIWRASSARVKMAGAPPDPMITYGYYIQTVETRTRPQMQRLGLSQTFPWFGKLSSKEKQAVLEAEAFGAKAEALRLSIIRLVKEAYYEYAYAVQAIKITRENRELLFYLEKVADTRYSAGLSTYGLTLRLQIETAKLEDRLKSLNDLKRPLMAKLNAAMGLSADNPIPEPLDVPVMKSELADDVILKTLEDSNPEINALQIQARAAAEGIRLAEKAFYPDFTFGVEIQQQNPRFGDPMGERDYPLEATVAINIPIWFEARRAAVAEASYRENSLRREAHGVRDRVQAAMQLALFKYRDAGRRLELFDGTLIPRAEQSMQATLDAFQTGTQSILDLIDVERTLLEFQLAYLRALADQAIYMAEMESLLGREIPCKIHSMPMRQPLIKLN